MNCENVRDLLNAYIDGEMSDVEARRIADHIKNCADCAREERLLRMTRDLVAEFGAQEAPAGFTGSVRAKIEADRFKKKSNRGVPGWAALAATFALVVLTGVYFQFVRTTPEGTIALNDSLAPTTGAPVLQIEKAPAQKDEHKVSHRDHYAAGGSHPANRFAAEPAQPQPAAPPAPRLEKQQEPAVAQATTMAEPAKETDTPLPDVLSDIAPVEDTAKDALPAIELAKSAPRVIQDNPPAKQKKKAASRKAGKTAAKTESAFESKKKAMPEEIAALPESALPPEPAPAFALKTTSDSAHEPIGDTAEAEEVARAIEEYEAAVKATPELRYKRETALSEAEMPHEKSIVRPVSYGSDEPFTVDSMREIRTPDIDRDLNSQVVVYITKTADGKTVQYKFRDEGAAAPEDNIRQVARAGNTFAVADIADAMAKCESAIRSRAASSPDIPTFIQRTSGGLVVKSGFSLLQPLRIEIMKLFEPEKAAALESSEKTAAQSGVYPDGRQYPDFSPGMQAILEIRFVPAQ